MRKSLRPEISPKQFGFMPDKGTRNATFTLSMLMRVRKAVCNMFTDILTASSITRANDEDLCSQINYVWTAAFLSVVGLLITMAQYVGDPIQCLCPAQLTDAQCNYTKALCWVKHNYFVHEDSPIAFNEDDRYELTVAYYPWIPWILFTMAAVLNVPNILWQSFAPSSGLDLKKFIAKADMHENLDNLGKILMLWLGKRKRRDMSIVGKVRRAAGSCGLFWCGRYQRSYLCGLVLFTKLGYLVTSAGCFFALGIFIDENMLSYGLDVVSDFLHGASYNLARFPVYTICDIKIRQLANVHTYSFQCVLPYNMFNQKIFIFLWFWFIIISVINAYSFTKWALHLLSYANRRRFVENYARMLHHLLQRKNMVIRRRDENADSIPADGEADGGADVGASHNPAGGEEDIEIIPTTDPNADGDRRARASVSDNPQPKRVRVTLPEARGLLRSRSHPRGELSARPVSSIEVDEVGEANARRERSINWITSKMMQEFGHDGVAVFRILENSVGIVISNRIFQELYEQLSGNMHFS
ncbi:innexin [Plakobranchus ocellatus]|uniref:Innexin n=1 Tax=Plakobranchus ocellatus TaxID=259542 RepID=A0AAV4BHC7_9GAST|nr:innexin [Plakobranchus ocellatus]